MRIVVGLGNPGDKYAGTRHNVGFEVLDELARRWSAERPQSRFESEIREAVISGEKTLLVAPQTYMNLSGRAVQQVVKFYQIPLDEVLVICDDLNLKLGQVRLRASGSAGGQKGLQSILEVLATEEVPRLRIGIDRPPPQRDSADYVLSRFRKEELDVVDQMVRRAATGVELWIRDGIAAAMNQTNGTVTEGGS
uniref:Peptidyl-tRNA hydrolase n=1 Tax=Schlesneria paludicola TaxID=360056 RepID=A0A7C2PHV4_9PLAN